MITDVVYAPLKTLFRDDTSTSRILLIEKGTANVFSDEDLSSLTPHEIDRKLGELVLFIFIEEYVTRSIRVSNIKI